MMTRATTTTTEGEAMHVGSIHVVVYQTKRDRTFVTIRTCVFLSLVVSLSRLLLLQLELLYVTLRVRVFCLGRLSLSFPLYRTDSLPISHQLWLASLVGVRFVLFVHLCCHFS